MLNLIRIYLKVLFLSDIVEGISNRVRENIWKAKRDKYLESRFLWPIAQPDDRVLNLWKEFIRHITYPDKTL